MSASEKTKRLFILDGTSFAYRSFFAIGHLSNSRGIPTNAVYGFARTLQKILADQNPDYIAVTFDTGAPTFRHEKLDTYKANRAEMPDELVTQLPLVHELLEAMRIPVVQKDGYEADDVMATMAREAGDKDLKVTILTGDKDMMQLVDDRVSIQSTSKELLVYDADGVHKKLGVQPKQVVSFLALTGDSSDNIPGVPGVGPKTAAKLLGQYEDVEEIYKSIEKIKPEGLREKLKAHRERVEDNLGLVRLHTDVPVGDWWTRCRRQEPDGKKLLDLYKRLEFTGLMKERMSADTPALVPVRTLSDKASLAKELGRLSRQDGMVFDLVTTDPHPMRAEILGIVLGDLEGKACYAPVSKGLSAKDLVAALRPILAAEGVGKVGHDLKYDAVLLLRHGVELRGIGFDTMLASYLLNPSKMRHGLGDMALEYLNERMKTPGDLLGKGKEARGMRDIPGEELAQFACAEASVIARLRRVLGPMLEAKGLQGLFAEIEIPLEMVLARMEHAGIAVDPEILQELSKEFELHIARLEKRIHAVAGEEFNIASTKELAVILFEKLKLPAHRRIKTGYSTDMEVLKSLSKVHELPGLVLEHRSLCKLKSTYSDVLPTLVHPQTGRIHTSFNQTVAATGRLSSSEPNLQNIPVRNEMGLRIRSAFIPGGKGRVLLGADYSQIELRVLAHLADDAGLQEAFRKDADVHRHTASLVYGVGSEEVSDDQRRVAKIVNFGILYGMGAYSLAKDMGTPASEAQAFIDAYFDRYHGVRAYIQDVLGKARQEKFVTTMLGRRRYLPEIQSSNASARHFAERTAVNTAVQGSAADIIKMAMLALDGRLGKATMLLQIHDELLFDVPRQDIEKVQALVREKMEGVMLLKVPLKVDIKTGKNWAEL